MRPPSPTAKSVGSPTPAAGKFSPPVPPTPPPGVGEFCAITFDGVAVGLFCAIVVGVAVDPGGVVGVAVEPGGVVGVAVDPDGVVGVTDAVAVGVGV